MPDRSSKEPPRKSSRPVDPNRRAFDVFQEAVGEKEKTEPPKKNPHAVALGRMGGKKGGKARAEKLSPEERSEIARKAAKARWNRPDQE